MSLANYPITFPNSYSNTTVERFLSNFYRVSDEKPSADHDPYVDEFTSDAYLKIGPNEALGHADIGKLRENIWAVISGRKHRVFQVFPFSKDSDEVQELAIYGDVDYTNADGSTFSVEWTARFVLSVKGDVVKATDYRVFVGPKPTLVKV
ncbi:hypothetical protein AWJ20_1395 [Sugiyamaella lignohabitans]|uniref:SnoaL-like domain-containing protein n=1 Tax=Sugiyamaella lignohabitans TaxID=796027 RepID=A0A167DNS7_9ASCO|nr:uncharacterized protein AWJ20_1395 [Sugiyamaella lignohabitans]ANB13114.1 hypothetical protein AWJ20_1395 [Sugiyamaella lignohabitans]